jgi:hypothetical protein
MKNKNLSTVPILAVMVLVLNLDAMAQTNIPAAPGGLRVQAPGGLTEMQLALSQLPPSQLEPFQPMPSRPMPSQPPVAPPPAIPAPVLPTPAPPGPINPGRGIEPVQPPPPFQPAQPGAPPLNRPPLITNRLPVFGDHPERLTSRPPDPTNRVPVLTNHPPALLPGDI